MDNFPKTLADFSEDDTDGYNSCGESNEERQHNFVRFPAHSEARVSILVFAFFFAFFASLSLKNV